MPSIIASLSAGMLFLSAVSEAPITGVGTSGSCSLGRTKEDACDGPFFPQEFPRDPTVNIYTNKTGDGRRLMIVMLASFCPLEWDSDKGVLDIIETDLKRACEV